MKIISVGSYQPRDRNTRNRTDLLLRPKATENWTTLETRQEMHRPHLVPLSVPLLGLCLKVVTLLLPNGSYTRELPSVRHVMNSMETLEKTKNTVQVKRREYIIGPTSTPFFYVRPWNVTNVLYEPLRRPDLTLLLLLLFLHDFRSVVRLFRKFGPPSTKYIRRKK